MNGQDLVNEALGLAQEVLSGIKESDSLSGDPLVQELEKACRDLESIKGRATLRTKNGTNMAFPVKDVSENLSEAWEDSRDGSELIELKSMITEFVDASSSLKESLKGRTVIMT